MLLIKDRLAIKGTWDTTEVPSGHVTVLLAPGIQVCPNVLGNPYSPTTRVMLEEMVDLPMPEVVLDLGSGNGILGLAAKALGAKSVHCYDNNAFCNETARLNVEANQEKSVHLNTEDVRTATLPKCGLLMCTVDDPDILAEILDRIDAPALCLVRESAVPDLRADRSRGIVGGYRAMIFRRA